MKLAVVPSSRAAAARRAAVRHRPTPATTRRRTDGHRRLLPPPVRRRAGRRRPRAGHAAHQARRGAPRPRADAEGRGVGGPVRRRSVYLTGFQPAVDEAVDTRPGMPPSTSRAAGPPAGASVTRTPGRERQEHRSTPRTRARGARPALLARPDAAGRGRRRPSATELRRRDPPNAARYRANAAALVADLDTLDAEFRTGLAQCRSRDLVTSHAAFGYLADALRPAPGGDHRPLAPSRSPTPPPCASSAPTSREARRARRSTPRAWSTPHSPRPSPARPAPRSRCSTRSRASPTSRAASDYLEVMRANLATLRAGQECTMTGRTAAPTRPSCTAASFGYARPPVVRDVDLDRAPGRGRGAARRQRVGQVHARARPPRADRASRAATSSCSARPRERFAEHTRHRLRAAAALAVGVGAGHRHRDRRGRSAAAPALVAAGVPRRPRDRRGEAIARRRPRRPRPRGGRRPLRGQQRRVLIARALAGRPELLVMDEPTAGVDHASQEALAEVLQRLADRGTRCSSSPTSWPRSGRRDAASWCLDAGQVDYDGDPAALRRRTSPRHSPGTGHHHAGAGCRARPRASARARSTPPRRVAVTDAARPRLHARRRLLAALLVGFAAPLVGVFLVQRRLSLIGDGMGHVALAGVAVGVLTTSAPGARPPWSRPSLAAVADRADPGLAGAPAATSRSR